MTSRNLTSNFFEFRNRATRDRHFHADDQSSDDRTTLLENEDEEIVQFERDDLPLWVESQRRIQLQLDEIRSRLKKLQKLHDKRLTQPAFDENLSEEQEIEAMTKDLTSLLHACHTSVQRLSVHAGKSGKNTSDQHVISNIIQATGVALQDLTVKFRTCQSTYIRKLESRKANRSRLMPAFEIDMHSNPFGDQDDPMKDFDQLSLVSGDQQQVKSENFEFTEKRDNEIRQALQSMDEIMNIFTDVTTLISHQRTHLDQIECHIEDTVVQLEQGNEQLIKAVVHQRRLFKFKLIMFGIGLSVILFVILITAISR